MELNYNELKPIDSKLLKQFIDELNEDIEEDTVVLEGKTYGLVTIDDGEWEDDGRGKYFSKLRTYILCLLDNDNFNVLEKYNVIITQGVTRTGSYYTDWYYEYDEPSYSQAYEKVVPEQIIPEHIEWDLKPLFNNKN